MRDYKELRTWATVRQLELIDAIEKHGTETKAAKALGINKGGISQSMRSLEKRAARNTDGVIAARQGHAPGHFDDGVAPGYLMGKVTVERINGAVTKTWERQYPDADAQMAAIKAWSAEITKSIKPLPKPKSKPSYGNDELMACYVVGDPHFGMYAWWQDAGDDFDLEIAERLTTGAVDRLVASAPNASTALFINCGDQFHADNQRNTSQSGHQLDVDGRWAKVQQVGLRAKIHCIRRLREKHQRVVVRINRGNHDGHSAYALSLMLSCFFRDDPSVEIDLSPATAWYFQFGSTLIGTTHGDTLKGPDLPSIMAFDKPKEWGETKHRFWWVGHVHHHDSKEYRGCIVEYFRTLAARDAWHQGQGYRSGRDMSLIVIHKDHGDVERHRCDIGMIEA